MSLTAPAKQERSLAKPHKTMQGHTDSVSGVVRLPDQRRIVTCSRDGSLRVWDLESGMQVGEPWKDEGSGEVHGMALSPDGKTIACGTQRDDGRVMTMGLIWWDTKMGKVIKKWTGHTDTPNRVDCICWSPDGGRVAIGGSDNLSFRVWDVKSGKIILAPIYSEEGRNHDTDAISYSPDGTTIATGVVDHLEISPDGTIIVTGLAELLKIWDPNTGKLLKTIEGRTTSLAYSSDGKTLFGGSLGSIRKFDTATWTVTAVLDSPGIELDIISLSPNERILASLDVIENTVQLWNLETNQPIGLPIHSEYATWHATFSADGKFLATVGGQSHGVYIWDVSTIIKEAGLDHLLSDNVNTIKKPFNAPQRPVPRIEGARRLPPGFFDDSSTSRGRRTTAHPQRPFLDHLPSFWRRRSNPRGEPERDIRLRNIPVVDVPCTAGKPRDYHARGKKTASSSRPPKPSTLQQHVGATQSQPSSSQPQPTADMTSMTGTAGAAGTTLHPHLMVSGWRARFIAWVCCMSIQNTDGQN